METKINHTFFTREANEGTATDIPFDVISPVALEWHLYERELDTLLAQGKIIAYGYTTLLPY